jgi:hypothetical protein
MALDPTSTTMTASNKGDAAATQPPLRRQGGDLVCQVVAQSDGKLNVRLLPAVLFGRPHLLRHLDDIYHAYAHDETRRLKYMQQRQANKNTKQTLTGTEEDNDRDEGDGRCTNTKSDAGGSRSGTSTLPSATPAGASEYNADKERVLVSTLCTSLEDAGFELLNRHDLDLCEALNAGYLLRLSIVP